MDSGLPRCARAPERPLLWGRMQANPRGQNQGSERRNAPPRLRRVLAHDPGDAARLGPRTGQAVLELAARGRPVIARANVSPGATALVLLAGDCARVPGRAGRSFEVAVVPSGAVDRELDARIARDDGGAPLHSGHAAGVLDRSWHLPFEAADGGRTECGRVREAPGAAPRLVVAMGRALVRVARALHSRDVVAARSVEADLRGGGSAQKVLENQSNECERDRGCSTPPPCPRQRCGAAPIVLAWSAIGPGTPRRCNHDASAPMSCRCPRPMAADRKPIRQPRRQEPARRQVPAERGPIVLLGTVENAVGPMDRWAV